MKQLLTITTHVLCDPTIMRKALGIAVVVGTILNIINQGDTLFALEFDKINPLKFGLTYCVPFLVSTYTAISMKMKFHIGERAIISAHLSCKACGETTNVNEADLIPECSKCGIKTHWKWIENKG